MTWKKENRKLLYGVGLNDADYPVQIMRVNDEGKTERISTCPYYSRWYDILRRCYNKKSLRKRPTYEECYISEEWKTFSNFKEWMEKQEWEGKQLDKDLIIKDNREYSAETCIFVSGAVNTFISKAKRSKNGLLVGVSWHKRDKVFTAQCHDIILGKLVHLGYHDTEEEAHQAYLRYKKGLIPKMLEKGLITELEYTLITKWFI